MKVKKLAISLATILSLVAPPALADLVLPWLSYRTGLTLLAAFPQLTVSLITSQCLMNVMGVLEEKWSE